MAATTDRLLREAQAALTAGHEDEAIELLRRAAAEQSFRRVSALFDMERYARAFESGVERMWAEARSDRG